MHPAAILSAASLLSPRTYVDGVANFKSLQNVTASATLQILSTLNSTQALNGTSIVLTVRRTVPFAGMRTASADRHDQGTSGLLTDITTAIMDSKTTLESDPVSHSVNWWNAGPNRCRWRSSTMSHRTCLTLHTWRFACHPFPAVEQQPKTLCERPAKQRHVSVHQRDANIRLSRRRSRPHVAKRDTTGPARGSGHPRPGQCHPGKSRRCRSHQPGIDVANRDCSCSATTSGCMV